MASLPVLPPASGGGSTAPPKKKPIHSLQVDVSGMDVDQLLELRAAIDERLPVKNELEQELVLQMLTTQKLQREVLLDDDIPAKQRAQVTNAVSAIRADCGRKACVRSKFARRVRSRLLRRRCLVSSL